MGMTRRKLTFNEKMVGELMTKSFNTYAQASGSQAVDFRPVLQMMKDLEKQGKKISYSAVFCKAIAQALYLKDECSQENILMNCRIEGDEIIFYDDVNIGIGINTPQGLMVIVIQKCQEKDIFEISAEIKDKIVKAMNGKLTLDDISGSTITISNLCRTNTDVFSSVITNDQACIMGFGAIKKGIMIDENDEIYVTDVIHVMQNVNHTACSGVRSARMFDDVCRMLSDPANILPGYQNTI